MADEAVLTTSVVEVKFTTNVLEVLHALTVEAQASIIPLILAPTMNGSVEGAS